MLPTALLITSKHSKWPVPASARPVRRWSPPTPTGASFVVTSLLMKARVAIGGLGLQ